MVGEVREIRPYQRPHKTESLSDQNWPRPESAAKDAVVVCVRLLQEETTFKRRGRRDQRAGAGREA